jgi:uncharacterized protein (TIGR02271 family)
MTTQFVDQVGDGMDVYDAADDKIGTVDAVYDTPESDLSASGGGYLRVPTGFLGMGTEHHIPFSAIRNVQDGNIYLNIARDHLNELGYGETPYAPDIEDEDGMTEGRVTSQSATAAELEPSSVRQPIDMAQRKLQLREEELIARKRSVETGAAGIHTEIVSEQRTLEVPVTHEEVTIERHAVDRRPSERPIGEGETIRIPVREEQVVVDKQAVVYEEVSVGKREVQDTQHVSDTVRREEAVVDKEGEVEIEGQSDSSQRPGR